jgi:hypothetical protein
VIVLRRVWYWLLALLGIKRAVVLPSGAAMIVHKEAG